MAFSGKSSMKIEVTNSMLKCYKQTTTTAVLFAAIQAKDAEKKTNFQRLRETFVGNDEHISVEEIRSNLLVHHVDISLVAGVEMQRVEPAGALN